LRVPRTVDDIIGEAAALPLRDAASLIWREKTTFERLEGRRWAPKAMRTPGATARDHALMPFEILHFALVLFRGRARFEGTEIAALAGLRIHFAGIEPVLT
jgi:hypothetical protein